MCVCVSQMLMTPMVTNSGGGGVKKFRDIYRAAIAQLNFDSHAIMVHVDEADILLNNKKCRDIMK